MNANDVATILAESSDPLLQRFPQRWEPIGNDSPTPGWGNFAAHTDDIDAALIRWLWDRGLLLHVAPGKLARFGKFTITLTPKVEGPSFPRWYHVTRSENVERIRRRGLLTGRAAGVTTSNRRESRDYIHVSLSANDAHKWACDQHLLKIDDPYAFLIDAQAFAKLIFRDPRSTTGYIVDAFHIPPKFLSEPVRLSDLQIVD